MRLLLPVAGLRLVISGCPMGGMGKLPSAHPIIQGQVRPQIRATGPSAEEYYAALDHLDLESVEADIAAALTKSQPFWPTDLGNYGPLMIRLAWHCAGTYRSSDGRGGCDGGRQRFDPERSWEDNTNLDKARRLLWPIKHKYGLGLSWGDLFTLAGTTAIKSMGGPVLGFCAGRVDDWDGAWSDALGPTTSQEELFPCPVNGNCSDASGLGTSTVGLIYVNPEGFMGNPDPVLSARQVRDVFARMGMNDSETVALIGGGHAFGQTHGACPNGAGPSPKEDPNNPWPGMCGTGKGPDTYTSGFQGPWTMNPTRWDNAYFRALRNCDWIVHKGPGDKYQWKVKERTLRCPYSGIMMLTSDIALMHDPEGAYQELVKEFADSPEKLDQAFSRAWYKLMTRDMGPATRCKGKQVPAVQPWQYPLPAPPAQLADFHMVAKDILGVATSGTQRLQQLGKSLIRLAFSCAWTFRVTDYRGGCNGARIRFSPEREWPTNAGLAEVLELLEPIKTKYGQGLSWADLIVLAGTVSIGNTSGGRVPVSFCGGRTDAVDGTGSQHLQPRISSATKSIALFKDFWRVMGLSERETVALSPASPTRLNATGSLSNSYFELLLSQTWEPFTDPATGSVLYRAAGGSSGTIVAPTDLILRWDPDYLAVVQEYVADNDAFLNDFANAWEKLMAADLFGKSTKDCMQVVGQI